MVALPINRATTAVTHTPRYWTQPDLLEAGHKRPSPPIIEVDATPANSDAANHNYETKPPPLPPTRNPILTTVLLNARAQHP